MCVEERNRIVLPSPQFVRKKKKIGKIPDSRLGPIVVSGLVEFKKISS